MMGGAALLHRKARLHSARQDGFELEACARNGRALAVHLQRLARSFPVMYTRRRTLMRSQPERLLACASGRLGSASAAPHCYRSHALSFSLRLPLPRTDPLALQCRRPLSLRVPLRVAAAFGRPLSLAPGRCAAVQARQPHGSALNPFLLMAAATRGDALHACWIRLRALVGGTA